MPRSNQKAYHTHHLSLTVYRRHEYEIVVVDFRSHGRIAGSINIQGSIPIEHYGIQFIAAHIVSSIGIERSYSTQSQAHLLLASEVIRCLHAGPEDTSESPFIINTKISKLHIHTGICQTMVHIAQGIQVGKYKLTQSCVYLNTWSR